MAWGLPCSSPCAPTKKTGIKCLFFCYNIYMDKIITKNAEETFAFAKDLVKTLNGGEVIALSGDLGAGKTVFCQGLAAGLGVTENVNSPTFVIMKVYSIKNEKLIINNFVHIDAYRLVSEEDIKAIGAEEYFSRADTVTVIEWPENIKNILPQNTITFKIKNLSENTREIKRA